MDLIFLAIMYFFVVVIIVLSFLLIKEKQLMYRLLEERDDLQEELNELKVEKVRMNHMMQMQDESIGHLMDELESDEETPEVTVKTPFKKHWEKVFKDNGSKPATEAEFFKERRAPEEELVEKNHVEDLEEDEPFIVLNNRALSRYEEELYQTEE